MLENIKAGKSEKMLPANDKMIMKGCLRLLSDSRRNQRTNIAKEKGFVPKFLFIVFTMTADFLVVEVLLLPLLFEQLFCQDLKLFCVINPLNVLGEGKLSQLMKIWKFTCNNIPVVQLVLKYIISRINKDLGNSVDIYFNCYEDYVEILVHLQGSSHEANPVKDMWFKWNSIDLILQTI